MRTTVTLTPAVHQRALQLAAREGRSLSSTLGDLVNRGLQTVEEPSSVRMDPKTGYPLISTGSRMTAREVANLLHDLDDDDLPA